MVGRIRIRNMIGPMVLAAIVAMTPSVSGADVVVGRPCPVSERTSIDRVDHVAFDRLLHRYVDEMGLVAYARWKSTPEDLAALEAYLVRLGCVDLRAEASREAKLAFWINAYNALTLHGILREYPTSSIRNHTSNFAGYNIWKDLKLTVGMLEYSLDEIEHSILRKMGEPRIHLALVCASKGCPPLRNRAYTADSLAAQLEENGRSFLGQPQNFRADERAGTVYLSKLFDWYGRDFAANPSDQLRVLGSMLPAGAEWATRGSVRVRYLDYDWSLNDQQPIRK